MAQNAYAVKDLLDNLEKQTSQLPSEYVFKTEPDQNMMPVKLIGGTLRPGIYHLPEGTTLTSLIALSGGKQPQRDSPEVVIRRADQQIEFDMEDFMDGESDADPVLKSGDIIAMKSDDPLVDQGTVNFITVISSVLSIVLAASIIADSN